MLPYKLNVEEGSMMQFTGLSIWLKTAIVSRVVLQSSFVFVHPQYQPCLRELFVRTVCTHAARLAEGTSFGRMGPNRARASLQVREVAPDTASRQFQFSGSAGF